MPKVSIIVPVYNVEQYLRQCLNSVVNQTLQDLEIICVNDGSTDGSLQILESFANKDSRIKLISKNNKGYGHTMNVGLDHATGEYIGIVESDDYVALNMYETLYKYAKKHNVDFIKADFYTFTGKVNNVKLFYRDLSHGQKHYYRQVLNPSENLELFRFIMNTWSGIYKKSFLDQHDIRHNETPGASYQDNGFYFQAFCWASRVYFIDKPLYRHRHDNPYSSINSSEKAFCINNEYDFINNFLRNNPKLNLKYINVYWLRKFHSYRFHYDRIAEKHKRIFLNQFCIEFAKARKNGGLNQIFFTKDEWKILNTIIDVPETYHKLYRKRNSKIAKTVTFIPRICSKLVAGILKTNRFTMPIYKFLHLAKHYGLKAALLKTKN